MKSYIYIFMAILLLTPLRVLAHGGTEKSSGNTIVFLTQNPISPLIGEQVRMNFVFAPKDNILERRRNLPVTLVLKDTFYGDETKDEVLLTREFKTDANGSFNFDYTYGAEGYFDIELQFLESENGSPQKIGFLVQPRHIAVGNINVIHFLATMFAGIVIGTLIKTKIS